MIKFLVMVVTTTALLSPIFFFIGKTLDFHFRGVQKNPTLDRLETLYYHSTYGTLLQEYAKLFQSFLRNSWLRAVLVMIALTILIVIGVEFYLFGDISLTSFLAKNYLRILPWLIVLGAVDYYLTFLIAKLAARGKTAMALILALALAYASLLVSQSILGAGFLPMENVSISFYIDLFINRLGNVSKNMVTGAWTVTSTGSGKKVSALIFALPAAIVSSSFMISAGILAALSTKIAQPVVGYFAVRALRSDEKDIHYKLSILFSLAFSFIISGLMYTVSAF